MPQHRPQLSLQQCSLPSAFVFAHELAELGLGSYKGAKRCVNFQFQNISRLISQVWLIFQPADLLPQGIYQERHHSSRHVVPSLTASRFGESRRTILPCAILLRTAMVSARFIPNPRSARRSPPSLDCSGGGLPNKMLPFLAIYTCKVQSLVDASCRAP